MNYINKFHDYKFHKKCTICSSCLVNRRCKNKCYVYEYEICFSSMKTYETQTVLYIDMFFYPKNNDSYTLRIYRHSTALVFDNKDYEHPFSKSDIIKLFNNYSFYKKFF